MKSRLVLVVAGCLALAACSSFSIPKPKIWPFYKKPKPVPEAVHELALLNADGSEASYPQYWKRNTLIIDLSGVSGEGKVTAQLPEESTWPVRVAVRVRPGSVGQLEVQAEERNVLPVTGAGSDIVDIELAPSVYTPKTAAIYITWSPQIPVVDTPPAAQPEPAFVSPTEVPKSEPTATDIVPPAEATPAQPSPPPGN